MGQLAKSNSATSFRPDRHKLNLRALKVPERGQHVPSPRVNAISMMVQLHLGVCGFRKLQTSHSPPKSASDCDMLITFHSFSAAICSSQGTTRPQQDSVGNCRNLKTKDSTKPRKETSSYRICSQLLLTSTLHMGPSGMSKVGPKPRQKEPRTMRREQQSTKNIGPVTQAGFVTTSVSLSLFLSL